MKTRKNYGTLYLGVLAALLLITSSTPLAAASSQCEGAAAEEPAKLESNAYFESLSPTEVEFRQGVEFEIVQDADGGWSIRFGVDLKDETRRAVADSIVCRCYDPDVCSENTCELSGSGTGNAKCRGGCYKPSGAACTSCVFLAPFPTNNDPR